MDVFEYIQQIPVKLDMADRHVVAMPMVSRLSSSDREEELRGTNQDKVQCVVIVDSLLYLAASWKWLGLPSMKHRLDNGIILDVCKWRGICAALASSDFCT
jgi:hypothetical protein